MPLLYTWKKAVRKKAKLGIEQQIASACSTISAEPHACYEHTARLAEKPPGKDARAIHRRCVARFFRSRNPPLSKMFHMRYFGSRRRPIIHPDTCEPFGFARRKEPARRRLSDSALELARIMRILLRSLRQRPSAFTFELALGHGGSRMVTDKDHPSSPLSSPSSRPIPLCSEATGRFCHRLS